MTDRQTDGQEIAYARSYAVARKNWNKTKLSTVGCSDQPTIDSFVLFQFHHVRTLKLFQVVSVFCFRDVRTPEIKQKLFSSQPITGSIV